MTRRILPIAEWPTLAGTDLGEVWRLLPPDRAVVLVVEDEGQIVGCWAFLQVLHAEGLWTHPAYRRGSAVQRHLLRGMREIAGAMQAQTVWTGSESADVDALCAHLGGREPGFRSWVIPTGRKDN